MVDDTGVVDEDGDGSPASADCDDNDALRFPGNEEVCDGIDNDCNEEIDDAAVDMLTGYADGDGDGYGDDGDSTSGCELGSGYVELGGDCDEANVDINPGAQEICDANDVDEDCDGAADDADDSVSASGFTDFYADSDGDGYGDASASLAACDAASGWVLDDLDCDDSDPSVYFGSGCATEFDGTYAVEIDLLAELSGFEGLSEVCLGAGEATLDGVGIPALTGAVTCGFTGIMTAFIGETLSVSFDGDLTGETSIGGEVFIDGIPPQPWTGAFNGDGTLTGSFSGSETFGPFDVNFDGRFTMTRD